MNTRAPRFCLADKAGNQVFVGDRITWYSDSWLMGKGRTGRMICGTVAEFKQKLHTTWRGDTSLITKVGVKADKNSYGDYDYGTYVTLSNLDNIEKIDA